MIAALVFVAVAVLFLALLLGWALLRHREELRPSRTSEGQVRLPVLEFAAPPPTVAEGIFSVLDQQFVQREGTPSVQTLFLRERRALARAWAAEMVQTGRRLFRFHREVVRHYPEVRSSGELKLAGLYALFLLSGKTLQAVLWLGGPFQAVRLAGRVNDFLGLVFSTYQGILAQLDPTGLERVRLDWARRTVAE